MENNDFKPGGQGVISDGYQSLTVSSKEQLSSARKFSGASTNCLQEVASNSSSRKASVERWNKDSTASMDSLTSPSNGQDNGKQGSPKVSKRILGKWHQAASKSKLGKGTKNLMDKWKSQHSASMDQGPDTEMPLHPIKGKSIDRKQSQHEVKEVKEKKSEWSEHVWSTWVHRGFSDDVTEIPTILPGGDLLSNFQKDKFRYFFYHVLDWNMDHVISAEDFEGLNERIRHYMDWSTNSLPYLSLKEVHTTFLNCFLQTSASFGPPDTGFDYWDPFKQLDALYDKKCSDGDVKGYDFNKSPSPEPKACVSIDEWVDVWGTLVGRAKKIDDFPMWLQYYPKVLFEIINRSGSGVITKNELKLFYTAFMDVGKLGDSKLDQLTDNAYNTMTSNGDIKLSYHIYKLSFLNFLLGKQPNGPGQFIFGTVTPKTAFYMFPIDYSAVNATDEDRETFAPNKLEEKGSRRSVIV